MKELASFNALVRRWADGQPAKYRLSALAFGYRCDRRTHSFSGTLEWVAKKSRERKGEGVSRPTLVRHLRVFEASGVISVERRRNSAGNMSSVYYVDFGKYIGTGDSAYDDYLGSLGIPAAPVAPDMPAECSAHGNVMACECKACREYVRAFRAYSEARDQYRKSQASDLRIDPLA